MSTEIIIYSCLSFVSLSLALGYLFKIYIPVIDTIPYIENHTIDEREQTIELVIQQEIIATL